MSNAVQCGLNVFWPLCFGIWSAQVFFVSGFSSGIMPPSPCDFPVFGVH